MKKLIFAFALLFLTTNAEAASNILTWTDNSNNEQNFNIERKVGLCEDATPFVEIALIDFNVTSFTDTTVTEGLFYCYRVRASNEDAFSAYSNLAGRRVPFGIPAAPSALGVVGGP